MSKINYSQRLKKISQCYIADRYRLRQSLKKIQSFSGDSVASIDNKQQSQLLEWDKRLQNSMSKVQIRKDNLPAITFPSNLPVSQKIKQIQNLFEQHQVIIIAGHTGSGKTTQLPKMCLQAGRGIYGKIAHTQPRRIAARSVADRIAQELGTKLGDVVGYKIRFQDHSNVNTYLKLMTDGILLAEIQTDRFLQQYDTIIIDEAHERSLNIDFLMGYLKKLLPKRPDLKIIITSATINTQRFSDFFHHAPIIEVSGQTFPVEIRYHCFVSDTENQTEELIVDINASIVLAVNELISIDNKGGSDGASCDILIFLSGEKEIREAHKELKLQNYSSTEIFPLYARLSQAEQSRIFKQHAGRRIILSTNIAETSLTIPGIRYVIDTGLAKISRYSIRNKIQRLPVEKISQASAQQRSGRCGRVSAGIAIRLYEEIDFQLRPEFTEPEILRTNLAQVILQMLVLKLGKIEDFSFIEAPQQKQINDGLLLLKQLDAIQTNKLGQLSLTSIGRKIAKLSIEPRLARIVIESISKDVLPEILVIVAALSSQDPRERPNSRDGIKGARQKADEKHHRYNDKRSDFISYLNLWHEIHRQKQGLSQNKFRKYCKENFLSFMKIREWQEIRSQVRTQLHEMGIKDKLLSLPDTTEDLDYMGIHLALLSGLTGFVATKSDQGDYLACRNLIVSIHPGSGLAKSGHKKSPKWIIAAEVVETQRVYARIVASIEPSWIEQQSNALLKHHYFDPQWDNKKGIVVAKDKMTLYGLIINPGKQVLYGPIDPQLSQEIFIKEALVEGRYRGFHGKQHHFLKHNNDLIEKVKKLEHKSRRQDILVDDLVIYEFYKRQFTQVLYGRVDFEKWYSFQLKANKKLLFMTEDDLKQHNADNITDDLYPSSLLINNIPIPLEYHFMPSHPLDGVTAIFPLSIINQLHSSEFEWLVPGLIREKVTLIFRSLPKLLRRHLLPIPDKVTLFLEQFSAQPLNKSILVFLEQQLRQHFGQKLYEIINLDFLSNQQFPLHLKMNYRIVDEKNNELDSSRDLEQLKQLWEKQAEKKLDQTYTHSIERKGITHWDFKELPKQVELELSGVKINLYPTLQDDQDSVSICLYDTLQKSQDMLYQGLYRLFYLALAKKIFQLLRLPKNQLIIQKICLLYVSLGKCKQMQEEIVSRLIIELCFNGLSFNKQGVNQESNLIYSQIEFEQRLDYAQTHLSEQLDEYIKSLHLAMQAYIQIKKVTKINVPINLIHSFQQVKLQLDQLYYGKFISKTPLNWLKRFPRYVKAIEIRLNKAANDPRKDQLLYSEFESLYQLMIKQYPDKDIVINSPIEEFRWLLEELKISLFAQEIKTIKTVSVKRMEKLWREIEKKSKE